MGRRWLRVRVEVRFLEGCKDGSRRDGNGPSCSPVTTNSSPASMIGSKPRARFSKFSVELDPYTISDGEDALKSLTAMSGPLATLCVLVTETE